MRTGQLRVAVQTSRMEHDNNASRSLALRFSLSTVSAGLLVAVLTNRPRPGVRLPTLLFGVDGFPPKPGGGYRLTGVEYFEVVLLRNPATRWRGGPRPTLQCERVTQTTRTPGIAYELCKVGSSNALCETLLTRGYPSGLPF